MFASIPSPSRNIIEIGPLDIRIYGLMIALGVIVAVWFIGWRMQQRSMNPEIAISLAWVAVPAGLIGARLYHVITDWRSFSDEDRWGDVYKIWEGGLGIPGAIIAGVIAAAVLCKMQGWSLAQILDIAAPTLLAAQAIGRLGNWFNQELFGRPTDLPWGLEIDQVNRPADYFTDTTFHPTFLYEALWMLALMGLLLWLDKLRKLPVGHLFALYVLGYASGRIWIEFLRVDPAYELAGVRVNVWVMSALWLGAVAYMYIYKDKATWRPAPSTEAAEGDGEANSAADRAANSEANGEEADEASGKEADEAAMAESLVMSARDIAAAEGTDGESPVALTDVMVAVDTGIASDAVSVEGSSEEGSEHQTEISVPTEVPPEVPPEEHSSDRQP